MSVLLVEDEQALSDTVAAFLEDEGMTVESVTSGEQAIALIKSGARPRVCIVDIRLPGMDGNSTVLALHQLLPELKFLVHTGSSDYHLPDGLKRLGMTETMVFSKPQTDLSGLAAAVKRGIDEQV